jgi:hypothetical protein
LVGGQNVETLVANEGGGAGDRVEGPLDLGPDALLGSAATRWRCRRLGSAGEVEEVGSLGVVELERPRQCLGAIRSPEDIADDDWRKNNPRFTEGNFEKNLRIVDEVEAVASELDATSAQIAVAWLLAQGDDIAPIPGTKRVSRVEENTAADGVELSAEQIERLNNLTPATGERHEEGNMAVIDR